MAVLKKCAAAISTMALLTMATLTTGILTMAILTMALPTTALLTMATLTTDILTMQGHDLGCTYFGYTYYGYTYYGYSRAASTSTGVEALCRISAEHSLMSSAAAKAFERLPTLAAVTCGATVHGTWYVQHARGPGASCPAPQVRTARDGMVRVACTARRPHHGRTCQRRR